MRFTELRESVEATQVQSVHEYHQIYLNKDILSSLEGLNGEYLRHLFSDLIQKSVEKDLNSILAGSYRNTNEYAKDCVEMALYVAHLHGRKVKAWTDAALKCFDGVLLCFIQDTLKETIEGKSGKEREKYQHLIAKGGGYARIGSGFDIAYQQRNEFTHVEFIDKDGRRHQKPLSNKRMKRMRDVILSNLSSALQELEQLMESH